MTTEVKPEPVTGTAKPEETKVVPPITPPATKPEDVELAKLQAKNAELQEENKQRRLAEKATKEKDERLTKALALLTGKTDEPDPEKLKQEQTDGKIRKAYLKAAFVSEAAKSMHDASFAFDALVGDLKDVKVDIETGEVDVEAIKTKLGDVKKRSPFLFTSPGSVVPPVKPVGNPDSGTPSGTGNTYQQWKDLQAQPGRAAEATEFYSKNRASILTNIPKG